LLAAFYYSWILAVLSLAVLIISEIFDYVTFRKILRLKKRSVRDRRICMRLLVVGTVLSALNIAGFAISIAILQGHTTHFMSLFFLLAAAIFATINNYQLPFILYLRLAIYFFAFVFIPVYDIVATAAPLSSDLWVQFFTSLFVMFFIADSARVSTALYRKTLQQKDNIRHKEDKTKAAYAAKSEFLAMVNHELRTPLTSIKGSLDLMALGAYGVVPERMEKAVEIAQRNTARLHLLINDLLDLQKLDSGRMSFHFEMVHIRLFLEQIIALNRPFADRFHVHLVLVSAPQTLLVRADEVRLEQVLSNMLSNAAKFSHSGDTVVVRATVVNDCLRIEVIDSGIGLSEEHRNKVFDEFSQLDSSDRRKIGGPGLGMNISRRIVDAHNGVLDYYANVGPGTTFYVELPLAPAELVEEALGSQDDLVDLPNLRVET
jgi:signal transduction histidine kinase